LARAFAVFVIVISVLSRAGALVAQGEAGSPTTPPPAPSTLGPMSFPRPSILFAFRFLNPRAVDSMAKELNLSDAQKAQVTELINKLEEASKPKIQAQHKAAEEFAVALADPSKTEAELKAAADKVFKAESDLVAENIKTLNAIRALLTQEQSAAMKKFLEQRTMPYRTSIMPAPAGPPPSPSAKPAK